MLSRREFLKQTACFLGSFGLSLLPSSASSLSLKQGFIRTKVSPYFKRLEGKTIMCTLCPRFCVVPEGKRGYCEVMENRCVYIIALFMVIPVLSILIPLKRSHFFMFFLQVWPFLSPLQAATLTASSVKTGKYHRQGQKKL